MSPMMKRTGPMQEFLDDMARSMGIPTQAEVDAEDKCIECRKVFPEAARQEWADVDQAEWAITHLCPECLDKIFADSEEEETGEE